MDVTEYKHVFFSLIFLKYILDAFEEQYQKLVSQTGNPNCQRNRTESENWLKIKLPQ